MVLSYYIYKYPYKIIWWFLKKLNKLEPVVFYCAEPVDYLIFKEVQKHLPLIPIIAKNTNVKGYLKEGGIDSNSMPSFPRVVIMCRHAAHKFPEEKIVKIGFNHGVYQFKKWTSPKNYLAFDLFFVSSGQQRRQAEAKSITNTIPIGAPKLDPAFDGRYDKKYLSRFKDSLKINSDKPVVLFSATWEVSGLSAIDKWIDRIDQLVGKYNILVTLHPWIDSHKKEKLKNVHGICFIEDADIIPYLGIADILVSDTSSIIGEFLAFNKPVITFKVDGGKRSNDEILELLSFVSVQISEFDELEDAIDNELKNPDNKLQERIEAQKRLFYKLDGNSGKRAAEHILRLLNQKRIL
jgi:hypothetical protein